MSSKLEEIFITYFSEGVETFLPHLSINCVVLGFRHPDLKVLAHKMQVVDNWLLPGGYVKKTESVDEAANRNLKLFGIEEVFLRQIKTFGDVNRVNGIDRTKINPDYMQSDLFDWIDQRFVSVVYYGLVNLSATNVNPGGLMDDFAWFDVDKTDGFAMDHAQIVSETRKILSTEILNYPVISSLLPELFTINELRGLFESILNRPIDRGTFRRKMLKLDLIEQIDEKKDSPGRPSHLFRLKMDNYNRYLEEENKFGF